MRHALVVLVITSAACSSDAPAGPPDASIGLDCSSGTCLTPPMLDVTNQGGASLGHMEVWTVVWQGDEAVGATVDTANAALLDNAYFTDGLSEYGVGAGSAKGVIVLGQRPAQVDDAFFDAAISSLIGLKTTAGATFARPNPETVVAFVIPKATHEPVGTSYHSETQVPIAANGGGSILVPYMVVDQISVGFVSDVDYLMWSLSHELGETATDPHPYSDPAWYNVDIDVQGEVADLCNNIPAKVDSGGTSYTVNRFYSKKLAKARRGDPCVPALTTPFISVGLAPLNLHIPDGVGMSGTLHMHGFSLGRTAMAHYQLYGDDTIDFLPASGTILPGQDIDIKVARTQAASPYTVAVDVWLTDVTSPNAYIPIAESYSAVTVP